MQNYVYLLTERKENNVFSNVSGFENNLEILDWLFGKRVVELRSEVKGKEVFQVSEDYRKLLKNLNDMSEINTLCHTFLTYFTQAAVQRHLEEKSSGLNPNPVHGILVSYIQQNLLNDIGYIIREEGKILPPDGSKILKKSLLTNYFGLTPQVIVIINSLHFQQAVHKPDFNSKIPRNLRSQGGQEENPQSIEQARRIISQQLFEAPSPKM